MSELSDNGKDMEDKLKKQTEQLVNKEVKLAELENFVKVSVVFTVYKILFILIQRFNAFCTM